MKKLSAENLVQISSVINSVFGTQLHKKRQLSIAYAAMGLLASETLLLHRMGEGLVDTLGLNKKHATKQIDRMLSNKGISIYDLSKSWIKYVVGSKKIIIVALDWSSFADDTQSMLSLNLVSEKGMSTPLIWKSVDNNRLKYNRARNEDHLLTQLKENIPDDVKVILLADRGFADQKFFNFLSGELKFDYVIRIKSNTSIFENDEKDKITAKECLRKDGHVTCFKNCYITLKKFRVKRFVAIKDKKMKAGWFLASSCDMTGRSIVNLYAKRWKIEPYFRDLKDGRYGYGLEQTHIKSTERRDRLMLVLALTYHLLITLGLAGEQCGFDKKLKVNTVKKRTHSLFRQGLFYYKYFFRFTQNEQQSIINAFEELLKDNIFWNNFLST